MSRFGDAIYWGWKKILYDHDKPNKIWVKMAMVRIVQVSMLFNPLDFFSENWYPFIL